VGEAWVSGNFLHDQEKIHVVNPKNPHAYVRDNGNDLSLEAV
jgi:hypothetical protein